MRRILCAVPLWLALAVAAGAEEKNTISVRGRGTVKVRPDKLVLVLGASGTAEKAADAVEKLNKKKEEIKGALEAALKDKPNLVHSSSDKGLSFGTPLAEMAALMGQGGEPSSQITVSTELTLTVAGVDKMTDADLATLISDVLDRAVDAGAELQPARNRMAAWTGQGQGSAGVYFGFSDYAAQVEKAWDEAAQKARDRAESIAKRLGLAVGDAVKVKDLSGEAAAATKSVNPYAWMMGMQDDEEGPKIKSSGEMELAVEMEVEFELKKK